jgi:multiple sugar transport system permease protein
MKENRKTRILVTIIVFIIAVTMVMPFIWMLSTSAKVEADVFNFPIEWIPKRWNMINNYKEVWFGKFNFSLYYWNSIKVTVLTVIMQVFTSALGAYPFAKMNFKYKNQLFLLFLATMMIPEQITLVPRFMIFNKLGLYNTHASLIIMGSFSVFGIFLLRQFMMGISDSLIEAAKIDGAGHIKIFFRIILPLCRPALATLALLKFVWTWNDYQNALIFLASPDLYTIQIGIKQFAGDYATYYSLIMAGSVSAILPLLIVFIIGQKNIIEGMTAGAVKG